MPRMPDHSIVPIRSVDPAEVLEAVRRDGAAVLTGCGPTAEDARAAAIAVFGPTVLAVPEPARVFEGGEGDRRPFGPDVPLPLHTDGFAYGALACDHILLSCVVDGVTGGESVLVDGYALIDELAVTDPGLHRFVTEVAVDQSEEGMHPFVSPLAASRANGRRVVRRPGYVAPAPGAEGTAADGDAVAAMLDRWGEVCDAARDEARRFRLSPGEVVVVDNDRVLHSRDAYTGDRLLWRVWIWTTAGDGVPAGMLHSDSRYAATN